jgi:hypothetical protein
MGLEARCPVVRTSGRDALRVESAAILWEGDAFIVRGEARARILREQITDTSVRGADLVVQHAGGSITATLGAEQAARWRDKIISRPKSRLEKLGIGQGTRVALAAWGRSGIGIELKQELDGAGAVVHTRAVKADDDIVLLLVEHERDLARIGTVARQLPDGAALWVVHPKGVGEVADVRIFDVARQSQLTYTKVASFSATHTAEKLVRPVAARASRRNTGRSATR